MRCFIAIPIDSATTNDLKIKVDQFKQQSWGGYIRWYPAENYHLTLQFLGDKIDPQKVFEITRSMENWFSEGMSFFEASLSEIKLFPSKHKAHSLITALDSTIMMQYLVREIEDQLKPLGFSRSKQAFRPHISLGKIPSNFDLTKIILDEKMATFDNTWLTVDRLTLYQSQLSDSGPTYTPLETKLLERYN